MIKAFRGRIQASLQTIRAHINSHLTHQRRFALVSNLDKTYQQLAKNVPADTEQIFDDDLPKRIYSIENNKQLLEIEKNILIKPKKPQNVVSKPWKQLPKKEPITLKQQSLQ